jgi:ubiquitin carboxyl-terminal hydrolase 2/21
MNTCLQNLIHSELFIQKLFSKSFLLSSKTRISKQFYSLCKEVSSCSSSACAPYDFKSAFGSKHSMFSGYGQHDTQEFCRILLEDMNSELNEVLHPAPYKELSTLNKSKKECDKEFDEVFRKRENSLVMDVFYGQLINIFKCECDFETYSFEKILDLPLLLQKHRSSISIDIKDLLKDYFECERIKFETKCEKCKKKEWHTKEIKISQPPNILILSLQRQNPRTGSKNNCYVDFSDELDMSIYLDHECWNKNDAKYTLYGIGNHSGSIDFGHYYAYIKINNSWYEFNDSHVSPYSKRENNSSSQAYILFYKKNSI